MEMLKPKDSVRLKVQYRPGSSSKVRPAWRQFLHQVSVARAARDLALGEELLVEAAPCE